MIAFSFVSVGSLLRYLNAGYYHSWSGHSSIVGQGVEQVLTKDVPLAGSGLGLVLVVWSFELGLALVSQAELPMAFALDARVPSHCLAGHAVL